MTLAALFGDGMVLQRGSCLVWGWGPAAGGHLELQGRVAPVVPGAGDRWTARWEGLAPGGPFHLTCGAEVLASNVWVGDVWLCAGQSNMERSLAASLPWPTDALALAGDPGIRQLCLPNQFDFVSARSDLPGARWIGADSAEVGQLSAVGFSFAAELRRRTGVPQGLVLAAVGGSSAQAWLGPGALEAFPRHNAQAHQYAQPGWLEAVLSEEARRREAWYADVDQRDPKDPTQAGRGPWGTGPLTGWTGSVWFRHEFVLPPGEEGVPARLSLGTLVDGDDAWVNGTWVGSTGYQYPSRRYEVPPGALRAGDNVLLVRLVAPREGAGLTPEKVRFLETASGHRVPLDGWSWRPGARAPALPSDTFLPLVSLGLHFGMLVPLAPLALRAVLWYQGESNLGDPSDYLRLQAGVVSEIRRLWARADLPFLVVQLPLFGPPSPVPDPDDPWVRVRQAQGRATDLGFTEVVPALDLGESYDIHPARKREVGLRLALAARKLVLGEGLDVWTGPRYQGSVRVDGGVRLRFDQTGTGLTTRGRTVTGFFVAGPGTGFSPAPAHLWGDAVRVDLPPGPGPWQVCYAWAAHPEEADLVNSEGLPMFPFQAWV